MLRVIVVLFLCFTSVFADLYNSSDPLVILNNQSFYQSVLGTENGWIIEFYNSWCGHCIDFAPKWREFSREVKDWYHTFKVGVIDCSNEENVALCRDFEIMAYPSIRIFGAFTKKGDVGNTVERRGIKEMQEIIIDFLIEKQSQNLSSDSWMNLQKYNGLIKDVFENATPKAKHAVLIVENADSKIASHTILDLGNYPMVYVRRVDAASPATKEIMDMKLPPFPFVIIISRDGKRRILGEKIVTREELTALIMDRLKLGQKLVQLNTLKTTDLNSVNRQLEKDEIEGAGDGKPDEINGDRLSYDDDLPDAAYENENQVYMVDMENAISYALKHEVMLHKVVSGEALNALKEFLNVLVKYFPARPRVHEFLLKLHKFMVKNGDTLTVSNYENALRFLTLSSSALPDQQPWKGCQGSQPQYRGYPCGLWTLFHTITVNALLTQEEETTYDPQEPLKAIHGYVKHFFSCEYCSRHFQEMYSVDAEASVRSPNDEVLWLWNAHNKVNKRLKDKLSDDPKHPKEQFPSKRTCPTCWKEGEFLDRMEALRYLKKIYGRGSISVDSTKDPQDIDERRNRQAKVFDSIGQNFLKNDMADLKQEHSLKQINSWGFNNTDVSLCVILYLCSTLIIVTGYMMFILKRKLRRRKFFDIYKQP